MVFLTQAEVAALLGVTRQWLYRADLRGDGPPMTRLTDGGAIRYDAAAFRVWLAERVNWTPRRHHRPAKTAHPEPDAA